jgi:hypothetical protein
MMSAVIPPSLQQQASQQIQIPQQLQLHPSRPGMPEGQQCPICSIVFYGSAVLNRHIKVAHPYDYETKYDIDEHHLEEDHIDTRTGVSRDFEDRVRQEEQQLDLDPPPTLHPEGASAHISNPGTSGLLPRRPRYHGGL